MSGVRPTGARGLGTPNIPALNAHDQRLRDAEYAQTPVRSVPRVLGHLIVGWTFPLCAINDTLAQGVCCCKAWACVWADYLELGLMFHEKRLCY